MVVTDFFLGDMNLAHLNFVLHNLSCLYFWLKGTYDIFTIWKNSNMTNILKMLLASQPLWVLSRLLPTTRTSTVISTNTCYPGTHTLSMHLVTCILLQQMSVEQLLPQYHVRYWGTSTTTTKYPMSLISWFSRLGRDRIIGCAFSFKLETVLFFHESHLSKTLMVLIILYLSTFFVPLNVVGSKHWMCIIYSIK